MHKKSRLSVFLGEKKYKSNQSSFVHENFPAIARKIQNFYMFAS